MRHYEIVFLVHPDHEAQVSTFTDKYQKMVRDDGGKIHRLENWGRRPLAYPIKKTYNAYYVLMNLECTQKSLDEIENDFRFNDAVMRHLTLQCKKAVTSASPMMAPKPADSRRGSQDRSSSSERAQSASKESVAGSGAAAESE